MTLLGAVLALGEVWYILNTAESGSRIYGPDAGTIRRDTPTIKFRFNAEQPHTKGLYRDCWSLICFLCAMELVLGRPSPPFPSRHIGYCGNGTVKWINSKG